MRLSITNSRRRKRVSIDLNFCSLKNYTSWKQLLLRFQTKLPKPSIKTNSKHNKNGLLISLSDRLRLYFQSSRMTIEKKTSNNLLRQTPSYLSRTHNSNKICKMQGNRKMDPNLKHQLNLNLSSRCKTNLILKKRSLKSRLQNLKNLNNQKQHSKRKFKHSNTITSATNSI